MTGKGISIFLLQKVVFKLFSKNGQRLIQEPRFRPQGMVFSSLRTYKSKPAFLDEHLDRLLESALLIGFDLIYPLDQIRSWVLDLAGQAEYDPQFLRIMASSDGDIFVLSRPLVFDQALYQGVKSITFFGERKNVKAKLYNPPVIEKARQAAERAGVYEALLINRRREITEGAWSNIFWAKDGILHWCDDALSGITQSHVLQLAEREGIKTCEAVLPLAQLSFIDELFLTQTSKGIVPIIQVDRQIVADGKPGVITQKLMKAFQDLVS
ncbi:MAG: aminotransferase class IV [bacterium]|nr:aminotransferase class IV [bacterium]